MLNLTSKKTLDAKMRVKSDIFAGWEEEIDHQVHPYVHTSLGNGKGRRGRRDLHRWLVGSGCMWVGGLGGGGGCWEM
jgi:hypothetical protein